MQKISKNQIKMIHILKNNLALEDTTYRGGLYVAFGVRTCNDLSFAQANALIGSMKRMLGIAELDLEKRRGLARREGFASLEQLEYIHGLWRQVSIYHGDAERERALRAFVERIAKVSDLRFLTTRGATAVISAMRRMRQKKTEMQEREESMKLAVEMS